MIWIVRVAGFVWTIFVGVPMIYYLLQSEWSQAAGEAFLLGAGWMFWHAAEVHRYNRNQG